MTIITKEFELYDDELLLPKQKKGWGGDTIKFMQRIQRPINMSPRQWINYAMSVVERHTK